MAVKDFPWDFPYVERFLKENLRKLKFLAKSGRGKKLPQGHYALNGPCAMFHSFKKTFAFKYIKVVKDLFLSYQLYYYF